MLKLPHIWATREVYFFFDSRVFIYNIIPLYIRKNELWSFHVYVLYSSENEWIIPIYVKMNELYKYTHA